METLLSTISGIIAVAIGFFVLIRNTSILFHAVKNKITKQIKFKTVIFMIGLSSLYMLLQFTWIFYKEDFPDIFNILWDLLDIAMMLYISARSEDDLKKSEKEIRNAKHSRYVCKHTN